MTEAVIPGVYDYCNRWCLRCPLSRRCSLRQAELEGWPELDETLDLEPEPDEPVEPMALHLDDPLVVQARAWMERCSEWHARYDELTRFHASCALLEALGHVGWYRGLVPAKVARAVASKASSFDDDASGSAKVAWLGLVAVMGALSNAWDDLRSDEHSLQLWAATADLAEAVDAAFPGQRAFRRPGFDTDGQGAERTGS